jgi:hypothetical protein
MSGWADNFGMCLVRSLRNYRIRQRQKRLKKMRDRLEREGMKQLVPFLTEEIIFGNRLAQPNKASVVEQPKESE